MLPVVTGRFNAETIPLVTVPDNPSGEPNAITGAPIDSAFEFASFATRRFPRLMQVTPAAHLLMPPAL